MGKQQMQRLSEEAALEAASDFKQLQYDDLQARIDSLTSWQQLVAIELADIENRLSEIAAEKEALKDDRK
ncbi:MAG: hypothetical protein FWG30_11580 [Eubacteriaceae bacterium]|nr:hypothetical protein [Eubacteriaceae bacterium]